MFNEISLINLILLALGVFVAYFLKGFSGFGPALIFIPTISILFNPKLAISSSAFIDLFVGTILLIGQKFSRTDIKIILQILSFMVIGTVFGSTLVGILSTKYILILISIALFIFSFYLFLKKDQNQIIELSSNKNVIRIASVIGGFTGGLVGISGPFIVMATKNLMKKSEFRRVLIAIFLIEGIIKIIVYASIKVWTTQVLELSAIASPVIIVGIIVGSLVHFKVSEKIFNKIISLLLFALSIKLFFQVANY